MAATAKDGDRRSVIHISEGIIITATRASWRLPALTVAIVAACSAALTSAEMLYLARNGVDGQREIGGLLLAHVIAGVVCAVAFGAVAAARNPARTPFLPYSERFLVGIGYGIVTSLSIAIAYGALLADTVLDAVANIGALMSLSLLSMALPLACIVGGLTWHVLTKAPAAGPAPLREPRPWEDQ